MRMIFFRVFFFRDFHHFFRRKKAKHSPLLSLSFSLSLSLSFLSSSSLPPSSGPHEVKYSLPGRVDVGGTVTARDIMIATGSVPFVPPGIPIDGKTVFTSDHALKLEWIPKWVAIIGSGYIGLEFSDVYTALGSEVTFIEAMDDLMPGFDREVARLAQRLLINPRRIDWHTGVLATKVTPGVPGVKPVKIELTDFKTKEVVDELEVDAVLVATGRAPYTTGLGLDSMNVETDRRGFVPVNERMQVTDKSGKVVPNLYCIGDANGEKQKMFFFSFFFARFFSSSSHLSSSSSSLSHFPLSLSQLNNRQVHARARRVGAGQGVRKGGGGERGREREGERGERTRERQHTHNYNNNKKTAVFIF